MTLVALALSHLLETLRHLQVEGRAHDPRLGNPPGHLIVERCEPSAHRAVNTGTALQRWRVDSDGVTSVALEDPLPEPIRDGMYYDFGRATFSLRDDGKTVRIGWQVGPRFGRGYDLPVEADDGGELRLGQPRDLWVS